MTTKISDTEKWQWQNRAGNETEEQIEPRHHRTHATNTKSRTKGGTEASNQEHEKALRFGPEVPSEPKDGPLQTGHAR
jgi:hypothetical protein